jgi:hypothetical protein
VDRRHLIAHYRIADFSSSNPAIALT